MKRCPQCEFIYEDEQSLCDMDGAELAYESRPFPDEDRTPMRSRWRAVVLIVVVGFVLGAVVMVVNRAPKRSLGAKPEMPVIEPARNIQEGESPAAVQPAPSTPTPEKNAHRRITWDPTAGKVGKPEPETTSKPSATPPTAAPSKVVPATRPSDARPAGQQSAPPPASQTSRPGSDRQKPADQNKKNSKVTSFLKKTGRILKRPLGFR